MNTENLKSQINALMEERYRKPDAFESFAKELLKLGVTRLTSDHFKNEMSFYTPNSFVHSLIRADLNEAQKNSDWVLGKNLDKARLEKAIHELDAGRLSAVEFHREIFAAGVIYCNAYLALKKIYYMGCDGEYYLETY